jgi:hypothetical protein
MDIQFHFFDIEKLSKKKFNDNWTTIVALYKFLQEKNSFNQEIHQY